MLSFCERNRLELIYYKINYRKLMYCLEKNKIKKQLRKDLLKHYSELNDLKYIIQKKIEDNIKDNDKENLINEINEIDI
tara:strand:- start:3653 stop:3889 length:237 start_codon:yes stop_codon:yes gene_type:complete